MSNSNGITAENLLSTLPLALQNDSAMLALATVVANEVEIFDGQSGSLLLYSDIDDLPGKLLDILATDFKIDWWDSDRSLDEKREMFKRSFYVHRHAGAKDAVAAGVSAIYADARLEEWWQYGGKPYHFRLIISLSYQAVDPIMHQRVIDRINFYKNRRSVLDEVVYSGGETIATTYAGVASAGLQISQTATAINV